MTTKHVDADSLSYVAARSLSTSPLVTPIAKSPTATPAAVNYVVARAIQGWVDEPERDAHGRTLGGDDLAASLQAELSPPASAEERAAHDAWLASMKAPVERPQFASRAEAIEKGREAYDRALATRRRGGGEAA
jgi:hypothetical protein